MPKTIADMLESGENVIGVWVKYYRLFKTICGKVTKDFGDGTVLIDGEDSSGPRKVRAVNKRTYTFEE